MSCPNFFHNATTLNYLLPLVALGSSNTMGLFLQGFKGLSNQRTAIQFGRMNSHLPRSLLVLLLGFPVAAFTPELYSTARMSYHHTTLQQLYPQDLEPLIQAATLNAKGRAMGGDFAGLAATFHPGSGAFIPVPEHLVPDALLDWGQEPKCLEILVSEEEILVEQAEILQRNTITVLPSTGCSIDNLETIRVDDQIDLSSKHGKSTNVVGLQYQVGKTNGALRLETVFGMADGYRMRVLLDVVPSVSTFAVQSPMVLAFERRTNTVSSAGTIADGGGLDGRTVSMLLGEKLRQSKTFVEDKPLDENYEADGITHVSFPGNVSLAYGWLQDDEWVVQVGHVHGNVRRVLSRQFHVAGDGLFHFDVESWTEDFVPKS